MHDRPEASVESISAVTIAVSDMARSVRLYAQLGFTVRYGSRDADFTSFTVGPNYLNLVRREVVAGEWGRIIFYASDVDAMYERALAAALSPDFAPRNAPWGERYFHLRDPDRHELSFARLRPGA